MASLHVLLFLVASFPTSCEVYFFVLLDSYVFCPCVFYNTRQLLRTTHVERECGLKVAAAEPPSPYKGCAVFLLSKILSGSRTGLRRPMVDVDLCTRRVRV